MHVGFQLVLFYIFTVQSSKRVKMDDSEIERLLMDSDGELSNDDDNEYALPLDEYGGSSQEEEQSDEDVSDEANFSNAARVLWRKQNMVMCGPQIDEDILIAEGYSNYSVLYSFLNILIWIFGNYWRSRPISIHHINVNCDLLKPITLN